MKKPKTLFERIAMDRNMSVEEVRKMISKRIEEGWNSPDPSRQQQWRKIPCAGEVPTPEEWLKYAVEYLIDEGREDLLGWYPRT